MLPLTVLNSCPLWHKADDRYPANKYDNYENDGRTSATLTFWILFILLKGPSEPFGNFVRVAIT